MSWSFILLSFVLYFIIVNEHLAKGQLLDNTDHEVVRDAKLSLFKVVRFENSVCQTINGYSGTCYKQTDCVSLNGAAFGTCALGFGVCCYFQRGCGTSTSLNNTYFVGPDTLGKDIGICQHTINKASPDICQIRLDFENFRLAAPNVEGECVIDKFTVTGTSLPVPVICGLNAGQHMYLNSGAVQTPIMLTISGTQINENRDWRIRSTQIPCNGMSIAPEGCLQYFTGVSGMLQSFNWLPESNGRHLHNQQYSICIRTEQGFCSICYSQCQPNTASFSLFHDDRDMQSTSLKGLICSDYVAIPCAQADTSPLSTCSNQAFCGGALNTEPDMAATKVCSAVRPFRMLFKTDADEMDDENSRGFCLTYTQNTC